jgi:hypothetical protein
VTENLLYNSAGQVRSRTAGADVYVFSPSNEADTDTTYDRLNRDATIAASRNHQCDTPNSTRLRDPAPARAFTR